MPVTTIHGTFAQQQNPILPVGIDFLWTDRTPAPCDVTRYRLPEYTEAQFNKDLGESGQWLNQLIVDAVKENEEGKTLEFP